MMVFRCILLFCTLLYYGSTERLIPNTPEWLVKIDEFSKFHSLPIVAADIPPPPREHLSFHLFTNENRNEFFEVSEDNLDPVNESAEKVFVLVHGWMEHRERPWYEELKNVLLDRYPKANVIQADFMESVFDYYTNALSNAKYIGRMMGDFLNEMIVKKNISPKNIIIICHSLGSHISGYAARTVKELSPRLSRIISLDPAGPPFSGYPCEKRLCENDADVVVTVHTDIGLYGYAAPIGTIDFYPNGGKNQNGCPTEKQYDLVQASVNTMCDHWRSWAYLIEAIQNPDHFIARRCEDWDTFKKTPENCDEATISLGDFETSEKGVFYFHTNSESPYAIENNKIKTEL